jgi:hypothetical protein
VRSVGVVATVSTKIFYGTGTPGFVLRLRNRANHSCLLIRRPDLRLADAKGVLPYRIAYHRRCVWFCDRVRAKGVQTPTIIFRARRSVFVAFHQYRCDLGTKRVATRVRLRVRSPLVVRLPGSPLLGWCGAGDPGSVLDLSPFEPTPRAAYVRG